MSFSSEVKEELSRHLGKSRHCQIAELAALIAFDGKGSSDPDDHRDSQWSVTFAGLL